MKRSWRLIAISLLIVLGTTLLFLWRNRSEPKSFYRVLCMGDSLTASDYGQYPRHLKRSFNRAGINAQVYAAARPGNTSGEYLAYLQTTDVLEKYSPNLVILMLGTNDVRIDGDHTPLDHYIQNMRTIIARIKNHTDLRDEKPVIFLATIPPIFHCDLHTFDDSSKKRVEGEMVPAIRELARQERLVLIDLHSFFLNKPAMLPGIHPTAGGYKAMAEFIFSLLQDYINKEQGKA